MCEIGDLVAIKQSQFGSGLKLKPKFLGPYRVIRRMNHDRYEVGKVGEAEGSRRFTAVIDYMKSWTSTFGSNVTSGGPNVGVPNVGQCRSERQAAKRD